MVDNPSWLMTTRACLRSLEVVGYPVTNPLFSRETIDQIFTPALTEQGSKSLSEFAMTPGAQWGTALAICTEDLPQCRRRGSVFCWYPNLAVLGSAY